ncbi:hypothetical protein QUB56_22060 [Microcoleus sp. AR_TQ3_B6]|uniref:hypothetical protein n=1 Tax=Microcoleus sp. AR_TQ3_B6 TaxID=3055284 RepID=UPI002FD706F8
MTDSSSLANTLSEPLRQPFWWAALASISLHGAFGASAPTISKIIYGGGNSSKNIPGSVGLVELTPAEAGRLPQTIPLRPSNKPFSIAPVPLRPSPKLAAPLPPAPPTINLPALPPGMPPPGFFSPVPYSALEPSPAPTAPPPPKPPSPSLKTPPQKQPTVIPQRPPDQQSLNLSPNIPPPPPLGSVPSPLPIREGLPTFDQATPVEERRTLSGESELSDPNDIASPEDFRRGGRYWTGADGVANLPQENPSPRNQTPEPPGTTATGQPINEKDPSGSKLPPDQEKQLAAANTYFALYERFRKAYPDLEMTAPTPVSVPYPRAACSQKLEGKAVFGAVVTPQGLLRAVPEPIGSTGYRILDDAAQTAIIDPNYLTFVAASTHKLYQLAVEFKYDEKVCSGIPGTPSPAPTRPNQARPQPTPIAPTGPRPTAQPPSSAPSEEKQPAPSTKLQPGAQPSPPAPQKPAAQPSSPAPQKPAAQPSPSSQPKPAAKQSPEPGPQPAEAPPQQEAAPSPAPEVPREPKAAPSPAQESVPPEAAPPPATEGSPLPEPAPSPTTEGSPAPSPSPAATTEN